MLNGRDPVPGSADTTGILRLVEAGPNPQGIAGSRLFLLTGDPISAPIKRIVPGQGVVLPGSEPKKEPFRLKVLHFNDLHGHVSRLSKPDGYQPIFSRMVWKIKQLRRSCRYDRNAEVVVMSAGDDMIGSVFDILLGDRESPYLIHAGYHCYSAAGLDVAGFGNHDFDMGTTLLARAVESEARFPFLCANLSGSAALSGKYYPVGIWVFKGIRLGVIGLITPGQMRNRKGSEYHIANPVKIMKHILPSLRPLCDIVIVLSHLGKDLGSRFAEVRDAGDFELAESLPFGGVDLIVGGHTHNEINEHGLSPDSVVNGIPIVQAGAGGRFLGEVDITLRPKAAVTGARLFFTPDLAVDIGFEDKVIKPFLKKSKAYLNRELGRVDKILELSVEAFQDRGAAEESALANFITDALVKQYRAEGYDVDFCLLDGSCLPTGFKVRGELTLADWYDLLPYADNIRLYRITGRHLAALLEDNARRIDLEGEDNVPRGFAHFSSEIRYKIVLSPIRSDLAVKDVLVKGRPLNQLLKQEFLIATSNFFRGMARSWEEYAAGELQLNPYSLKSSDYIDTDSYLRELLAAYISDHGGVTGEGGARRDGRLKVCLKTYPDGFQWRQLRCG